MARCKVQESGRPNQWIPEVSKISIYLIKKTLTLHETSIIYENNVFLALLPMFYVYYVKFTNIYIEE